MKKIIVIALFVCLLRADEQGRFMDYYRKAENLAWLELAYCMRIDEQKEIEKELHNLSLDPTKDDIKIMDANAAFKELKVYIDEEKEFYEISNGGKKLSYKDFKGCMKMFYYGTGYGSNYHFQVEQIVKKYCKECE